MQTKLLNKWILIWLFLGIPLLAAFILRKSFDLGLYGDDWQHLYNLWRDFFVYHTKSFFDIKSYLNPYWPNYFYLGIISHFWGYYPPAYFIASYFMRLFANIALYFFSYELTKSKLAAFLTTLIFLVSAAGLQTTDWVFNMNTYAGLGLLVIASTIYLKLRKIKTFKSWYYLFFITTFTLALGIVPTRMHGATPFIILMDIFLTFIMDKQKKIDKYLIARIALAAAIFFLLIHLRSFGEESYAGGRFNESYKIILELLQNGVYSFWLYFLAIIGHLALPDNINLSSTKSLTIEVFLSILLASLGTFSILKSKRLILYLPIVIFNFFWLIFLLALSKIDFHTSKEAFFAISLGGQVLFWAIWFFSIGRKKYPDLTQTLIISIFWITSLTILHWIFTPYYIIETTGRYMTMGAAGMAIFLGALSALLIKNVSVPLLILFFFIITNFYSSQSYLNILHQTRNKELTEKTWNTLIRAVPNLDPEGPSVFYFTTDNPSSLFGVLEFGFFMRAGMTYRIPDQDLTPLPSTSYKELLSFVKDGSPLQKVHGRKAVPVPLSRIFAFDFRNGQLIPITEQVRKKLVEDLNQ